jgi:hypothetical protein
VEDAKHLVVNGNYPRRGSGKLANRSAKSASSLDGTNSDGACAELTLDIDLATVLFHEQSHKMFIESVVVNPKLDDSVFAVPKTK